jgi:hypothetical protein
MEGGEVEGEAGGWLARLDGQSRWLAVLGIGGEVSSEGGRSKLEEGKGCCDMGKLPGRSNGDGASDDAEAGSSLFCTGVARELWEAQRGVKDDKQSGKNTEQKVRRPGNCVRLPGLREAGGGGVDPEMAVTSCSSRHGRRARARRKQQKSAGLTVKARKNLEERTRHRYFWCATVTR